jgi:hypothetical protein
MANNRKGVKNFCPVSPAYQSCMEQCHEFIASRSSSIKKEETKSITIKKSLIL